MRYVTPVFFLLATLIIALFHTGAYSYVPFIIMCGLIGYTFFLTVCYKQTTVSIELLETNMKTPTMQLTLHKKHPFPLQGTYHILCQHTISGEQQQFFGAFSTTKSLHTIDIPTAWQHCGNMQIIKGTVTFTDPLSWSQVNKEISSATQATLWPTLHLMGTDALSSSAYHIMGHEAGDHERIVPYTPGDPIQAVHWALSAKLQTLMIQKPAFAETKYEMLALYFNDIEHIHEYDEFMNTCYSLLNEEQFSEVSVWTGTWQTFSIQEPQDITTLFHYLLQQPLDQLYAPSLPNDKYKIIRYKEEQIA